MIRHLTLLILCLAAPLASAQARETSRDYMTTSFDEVAIDGPIAVVVTTNANPSVVAYGDADMIERLIVRKNGGRLRLSLSRTGTEIDPARRGQGRLRVEIASWEIDRIDVNGPADVRADALSGQSIDISLAGPGRLAVDRLDADIFAIRMIGNGSLSIGKGGADEARVDLDGAPSLDAGKFQAERLLLSLTGPASVRIGARDSASISASGAGKVDIVGRPTCDIQSAGMAEIACGTRP